MGHYVTLSPREGKEGENQRGGQRQREMIYLVEERKTRERGEKGGEGDDGERGDRKRRER
eukprot:scaffold120935_cov29-Tisochrysis_lutea.AAC.5